jgi:hypothetical protein
MPKLSESRLVIDQSSILFVVGLTLCNCSSTRNEPSSTNALGGISGTGSSSSTTGGTGGAGGTGGTVASSTGTTGGTSTAAQTVASQLANPAQYYYLDQSVDPQIKGITYYVSDCKSGADANCIAGKDSNSGTSPSAPWQTCSKLLTAFNNLNAGDRILIAKGAMLDCSSVTTWISNLNCLGSNPCFIDSYVPPWASGDEKLPVLHNGQLSFQDGGNAVHDEGYVVRNIELRGDNLSIPAVFFYNDVDDVLLENLAINGYDIGVQCAGSNPPAAGGNSNGLNEHITLRNSDIRNNPNMGFLGACPGTLIQNNNFDNNGSGSPTYNHTIYVNSNSGTHDIAIWGNTLTHSTLVNGKCSGTSLVAHGVISNLLIAYNSVIEDPGAADPGCWGISVDPGYSGVEDFTGTIFRGNTVVNVGNVSIGTTACPHCIIENNIIINNQSQDIVGAIVIPDKVRSAQDVPENNATIRNNSIYLGVNTTGTGISIGTEGSNHVVASNVIQYAGTGSNWRCFSTAGLSKASFTSFDYNLCYFQNSSGLWEATGGSLSAWRSSTGLDAHSLGSDPLYTSVTAPNYSLRQGKGSPVIDSGHPTLSSPLDALINPRDTKPDMGAYEGAK